MKHALLLAICTALLPTLVFAQTVKVKDCRTLEAAGNFIGADEVMVDGLVCKIAKPKTEAPAATPANRKEPDTVGGEALLGIIDAKKVESAGKAGATGAGGALAPSSSFAHDATSDNGKPLQDATFEIDKGPSLGDVARAYRHTSSPPVQKPQGQAGKELRATTQPKVETSPAAVPSAPARPEQHAEVAAAAPKVVPATKAAKVARPEVEIKLESPPATSVSAAPAPVEAPVAAGTAAPEVQPVTAAKSNPANAAKPAQPEVEIKLESAPATSVSTAPAPIEAPSAARAAAPEVQPTAPKSSPATNAARAPQPEVEIKLESSPATSVRAAPAPIEAPSAESKTGVLPAASEASSPVASESSERPAETGTFDAKEAAPAEAKPEVQSTADFSSPFVTPDRPQEIKTGIFAGPEEMTDQAKPQMPVDPFGQVSDDGSIQEPRAGCTKIISLGRMEKERLILAIPDWAMLWLEKNQKRFPGACFADSPLAGVPNYLIVFFTEESALPASAQATKEPVGSKDTKSAGGTFTTSFGSTWHYTFENAATTTVTTAWTDKVVQGSQQVHAVSATAYSEQGIPISQHWPGALKGKEKETSENRHHKGEPKIPADPIMSDLLEQMMADISVL